MKNSLSLLSIVLLAGATLVACGGAQTEPAAPTTEAPAPTPAGEQAPASETAARPSLSAQECEAAGGTVVGDIGDGAIHRPDYKCPNGAAPSGSIRPAEGGPIAVEGSVCCPK